MTEPQNLSPAKTPVLSADLTPPHDPTTCEECRSREAYNRKHARIKVYQPEEGDVLKK